MSKDKEGALYYLMTETFSYNENKIVPLAKSAIDDLQELVNRDKPIGVVIGKVSHKLEPLCPVCEQWLTLTEQENFCPRCGQRLDWKK